MTESRLCKFFGAIICLLLLLEFSFIRQTSEDVAQMPEAKEILSNAHETAHKELREERKSFLEEQERKKQSLKKQKKKQEEETFTSSVGFFGEKIPKDEMYDKVLSGKVHLIGVSVRNTAVHTDKSSSSPLYKGVIATFCKLKWDLHKYQPESVPMFNKLTDASHCSFGNTFSLPLDEVMEQVREYDSNASNNEAVKTIPPSGFVFHESRCGSTLVANSLAVVDPEMTRVYSESAPLISAMKACGAGQDGDKECDREKSNRLIQDVVYLNGRTNDMRETRMFYKIQSIGTTFIHNLREAFPDVPWIFVYRDPVQVMMSHIPSELNIRMAVCIRSKRFPSLQLLKYYSLFSDENIKKLSRTEHCAVHLGHLCNSILEEYNVSNTGRMVNYDKLPDILLDDVFPNYFGIPVGPEQIERVKKVNQVYSKGGVQRYGNWTGDSEHKEKRAYPAMKDAADAYLYPIYTKLEEIAEKGSGSANKEK